VAAPLFFPQRPACLGQEKGGSPPAGQTWRAPSSYCTVSSRQGRAPAGAARLPRALGAPGQAVLQASARPEPGAGVVLVQELGNTPLPAPAAGRCPS
jgi:hypothetical protein